MKIIVDTLPYAGEHCHFGYRCPSSECMHSGDKDKCPRYSSRDEYFEKTGKRECYFFKEVEVK